MDNKDFELQKENLFRLIETWDQANIDLAFLLIKKNPPLKEALKERYLPLLNFMGYKSLLTFKNIANKIVLDKKLSKTQWIPDKISAAVLATLPIHDLNLQGHTVKLLPEWICHITQLQHLRLNHKELESLPEAFGQLTQLKKLILHNNALKNLPLSFGNLKSLENLHLDANKLTSLPPSFGNLAALSSLSMIGNNLRSLPLSFGQLSQLQTLSITGNNLQSLPKTFGNLSNLKQLEIKRSKIAFYG